MKKKNIHIFCSLEIMITSERNKNSINEEWGSEKKLKPKLERLGENKTNCTANRS